MSTAKTDTRAPHLSKNSYTAPTLPEAPGTFVSDPQDLIAHTMRRATRSPKVALDSATSKPTRYVSWL
ncbi:hypothetical protein CTheo_6398 [Ceratobasidium theobromae]|uniref:Uncharacterized protein n=1 Tax=Ceratobasidium theobromae TaxID=1582974 RepID=A0A5N5QFS6_9AGAM|nr:hypothetical protein CTheo_6398 [Ceratobasidium theobromae]